MGQKKLNASFERYLTLFKNEPANTPEKELI